MHIQYIPAECVLRVLCTSIWQGFIQGGGGEPAPKSIPPPGISPNQNISSTAVNITKYLFLLFKNAKDSNGYKYNLEYLRINLRTSNFLKLSGGGKGVC